MGFDWSTSVFHSAMKHENDVNNVVGCLYAVKIYSTRFVKLYRRSLCLG